MKPSSSRKQSTGRAAAAASKSSASRLFKRRPAMSGHLSLVAAAAALAMLAMTLNERAAVHATRTSSDDSASSSSSVGDTLTAMASSGRPQRQLAALAKRETITQHQTTTSEHKLAVQGGGAQRDLSIGQSIANAKVQMSSQDMQPAAAGHYGGGGKGHGKYYMYAESPKKGAYKAGFKRGNHKHMIERKESQHKSHAHGYMKWHAKKGKGSHKWEFKHSKGKHGHY